MQDPTRDEMLAYLREPWAGEIDESDIDSNLYAALCASPYHPSPIASGVESASAAEMLYEDMVGHYG